MENKTTPIVSKSLFIADVVAGMTKSELITKWKISSASVKQLATKCGVTIKRAVTPKYVLVDDEETETTIPCEPEVTFESLTALNN